ncbi:MAG TPA: hypothetical protein PLD20_34380 [Blastocatellia bacterium]|nr:hypothetical protein [Blastocatellia bacterium]HMV82628.1 hypothetical protein [Blastocatellia bacterium]HMX24678.1 hypothetical protein [Blastocatellia bacterium]HMY72476.1 hypothetical protein [Blastocatellia bacterium]HMZ23063.1 hypothetical protein [Blastocatellia bacterium]
MPELSVGLLRPILISQPLFAKSVLKIFVVGAAQAALMPILATFPAASYTPDCWNYSRSIIHQYLKALGKNR